MYGPGWGVVRENEQLNPAPRSASRFRTRNATRSEIVSNSNTFAMEFHWHRTAQHVRSEAFSGRSLGFSPIHAFMVIRRGTKTTKTTKNVIIRQQAEGYVFWDGPSHFCRPGTAARRRDTFMTPMCQATNICTTCAAQLPVSEFRRRSKGLKPA